MHSRHDLASRPTCPTLCPARRDQLGARLASEWQRLRGDPRAIERAGRWKVVDEPIFDLDQVLVAVGFRSCDSTARPPTDDACEGRLARLVGLAATDELAGRVVIQRLLPGLMAQASRRSGPGRPTELLDELVGAAWISVRTYNTARRPACLAAALLADAVHGAFRAPVRRRTVQELPTELAGAFVAADRDRHPAEELADLFRAARSAGIADGDLDILRTLLDTPRMADAASALNVTPRTVRNRRDRATARLREVALAAA